MKKNLLKKKLSVVSLSLLIFGVFITGCRQSDKYDSTVQNNITEERSNNSEDDGTVNRTENIKNNKLKAATELEVRFGYDGNPFVLHLDDNETAETIAIHVGTTDWNLPINHYDDYENYEVMQYYDIPSSYDIPSNPKTVSSEKAGEVYYSHPNRIILFYQDAEVTGEYTKVGYIDYSDEFYKAVVNNPVLEDWGTKIVSVTSINE